MRILKYNILFFILCQFSCDKNEIEFQFAAPSLLPSFELPELLVQEAGNDIFQEYALQAENGLLKFEIFLDGDLIDSITYSDAITAAITDTYSFQYTIPPNTPNGTESELNFVLTDQKNQEAIQKIRFLVNTTFFETVENINGTDVIQVRGRLNSDYTMQAANIYLVDGVFSVQNNSELTIEADTKVYFKTYNDPNEISSLVITQGSKILAEGTAIKPIIFTSDKQLKGETPTPADWGGVTIYGNAPSNKASVILDEGFRYGGNIPNDNSGVLRYIRSEYAGGKDAHAFQFFGVGSGTQIDHIQVYRNDNMAFRLRGGRINLKYIAAIGHGGYGIWADEGWQGLGQFWIFQTDRAATLIPVNFWNLGRSIEMRNDPDNFLKTPRTTFVVSNVTCIGNGYEEGVDTGTRRGVRIRRGAIGTFQNAIITEFPNDGVRVEDLDIEVLGVDMIFDNIRSFGNSQNYEQEALTIFFESGQYDVTEEPVLGISLSSFVGSSPSPFNPSTLGSFFSGASYIGAVESISNDWTTEGNWFKNLDGSIR